MTFDIRPATAARFDDLRTILGPKRPGAQGCWCLAYRVGHRAEQELHGQARADAIEALCRKRSHAPAVLAYDGDEVVGAASLAPRSELPGFTEKDFPRIDDVDAWTVFCFRVRAGHGKQGIAHALLAGAVDHARGKGAPAVEGFPVDNAGARIDRTFAHAGTRSMFERAGFREVGRCRLALGGVPRLVMRLDA